jgi:uncharacterized membrane protein HdeD (DUF308 family)
VVRLMMILLGVEYLRKRWVGLMVAGSICIIGGIILFVDAIDGVLYFPIQPFAWLLLLEGIASLIVARTGIGGQRQLRYVKGIAFVLAALLILNGQHNGNFVLSMIFGTLFLVDGILQIISATLVRFKTWRLAIAGGVIEILLAIFFYLPYPTNYAGTVPFCLGLGLIFGGWSIILIALRVRRMKSNPAVLGALDEGTEEITARVTAWDGPPGDDEPALTVHVWTPVGSAKTKTQRQPIIDRYIAAIDKDGVISTGHAALEAPQGIYISLYPAVEIDRSPSEFTQTLRATHDNDVPGTFQPDYATESKAWCPSTRQVRIRNYDAGQLRQFWDTYRQDETYNLTHRNCSSTVAHALDAAIEGAAVRLWGKNGSWKTLIRLLTTPELWVAVQIRKRAETMAWTPGLTLDYARALSMLADPRTSGWIKMARGAIRRIHHLRKKWRRDAAQAPTLPQPE